MGTRVVGNEEPRAGASESRILRAAIPYHGQVIPDAAASRAALQGGCFSVSERPRRQ